MYHLIMAINNDSMMQVDLLKRILQELKGTNELLEKLVKINLNDSKTMVKEAREHRKKMLVEAKKILETPNREAMILEELKKRGYKA